MFQFRQYLTLILSAIGVLVLAFGSVVICITFVGTAVDSEAVSPEAAGYAFFYIWPITMLLFCLFGLCALIAARRNRIRYWAGVCYICWASFVVAALIMGFLQAIANQWFGLFAIPLLLIIDGFALYSGWRLLFRQTPAALTA